MRKPEKQVFLDFCKEYKRTNERLGLKQYLIPYLISSHPGSRLTDAVELAVFLKKFGFVPDQVQDFYPTPGTLATCMYYTEKDPFTGKSVYVAKDMEEKRMQRALIHFNRPENRELVMEALRLTDRQDLCRELFAGPRQYSHHGSSKSHNDRRAGKDSTSNRGNRKGEKRKSPKYHSR